MKTWAKVLDAFLDRRDWWKEIAPEKRDTARIEILAWAEGCRDIQREGIRSLLTSEGLSTSDNPILENPRLIEMVHNLRAERMIQASERLVEKLHSDFGVRISDALCFIMDTNRLFGNFEEQFELLKELGL